MTFMAHPLPDTGWWDPLANLSGVVIRLMSISISSLCLSCYGEVVADIDCLAGLAHVGVRLRARHRPDQGQPGKAGDSRQQKSSDQVPKQLSAVGISGSTAKWVLPAVDVVTASPS